MKIYFESLESFYNGIYQLTVKGLTFRAYADGLVIELTGGFKMIYVCIFFFQIGAFVIADALTRLEKQGALTRLDVFIGVSTIVGLCSMACFLAAMSVNAV